MSSLARAGALLLLLAGCSDTGPPRPTAAPSPAPTYSLWAVPTTLIPPTTSPPPPSASASATPSPRPPAVSRSVSSDWEITVYYTAVEKYHTGEPEQVTGCPRLDCTDGDADLGTYPSDFVQAVQDEGTGRTSSGRYLNWSYDVGYWLDTTTRDSDGAPLRPFVSAAADPDVLPHGTRFTVSACGTQDDGSRAPGPICAALRDAAWVITDEFTPGLGGSRHIDAYIGEETGPDFTASDWYLTLTAATLTL